MHLTPREVDKLLIFSAAQLARTRRARGLKLNHPEAVALITAELLELIGDGRSVAEIMSIGPTILSRDAVMDGVISRVYRSVGAMIPAGGQVSFETEIPGAPSYRVYVDHIEAPQAP